MITVYSKTTGRRQRVPEHWLDNPVLGRDFQKTPPAGKAEGSSKKAAPARRRPAAKKTRGSATAGSARSAANTKEKK